jgi:hypothetical protein
MASVHVDTVREASERRGWPIFVVGCHRSGTSLLRYILDAHPHIACPGESKFIAGVEAFLLYPQALQGLVGMGISVDHVHKALHGLIDGFFATYAEERGKRRWADKTPNYYRLLPLIDRIFSEKVLFVWIIRHPLDTIASLESIPAFAIERPDDPDIASAVERFGRGRGGWALYWSEVNSTIAAFATVHPERCLRITYEELVVSPEPVISDLLEFLGEQMPTGFLSSIFSTSHTAGYGDARIRTATRIHAAAVGRWRHWPTKDVASTWAVLESVGSTEGYCASEVCNAGTHEPIQRGSLFDPPAHS